MKESEFQGWVVETAERFGWKVWHAATPMRPIGGNRFVPDPRGRGLPDLFMLHDDPPRLILAEIKNEDGTVSIEQREFLRLARKVAENTEGFKGIVDGIAMQYRPLKVFVWRPAHRDLIEAVLRGADVDE